MRTFPLSVLVILSLLICLPVWFGLEKIPQERLVDRRCDALLNDGHWTGSLLSKDADQTWIPSGCMLHTYGASDARTCLTTRSLTFLGDSTARQLFWAVARQLDYERAINISAGTGKHTNIIFAAEGAEIDFIWDPFLNETSARNGTRVTKAIRPKFKPDVLGIPTGPPSTNPIRPKHKPDMLVIGAGLWHVKHLNNSYLPRLTEGIGKDNASRSSELDLKKNVSHDLETLLLPITISVRASDKRIRSENLTRERIHAANAVLAGANTSHYHKVLRSYLSMVNNMPSAYMADGIHISDEIASTQAQVLLNYMCNDIIDIPRQQSQEHCCSAHVSPNPLQKAILLGGVYLIVYHLLALLFRCCSSDVKVLPTARTQQLSGGLATVSFAVLCCFASDRTALFGKESKTVDQTMFLCITALSCLSGFTTLKSKTATTGNSKGGITSQLSGRQLLSRDQTEEWKGWMQIVILLYHYFAMSKVLWVYQFVRLLVASYIFMTAWGHTMYFIRTNDFSLRRVVNVLMRTNLLNVILAFAMGTQYDLYYFPVLSSVWFLIVWITIPRASSSGARVHSFCFRLVLSITIVSIIRSRTAALEAWLASLDSLGPGIFRLNAREFVFRFSLDAYIAYLGMVLAFFYSRFGATRGSASFDLFRGPFMPTTIVVLIAACNLVGYTLFCGRVSDKHHYNRWHPFISPLPVMAFVVLRNSTSRISRSHSRLFAWFGRCSLETFVLQYHIWLGADTHGLLRFGMAEILLYRYGVKGTYWWNMLDTFIVSVVFLGLSHSVSKAMPVVVTSFLGDDVDKGCLKQWREPVKDNMTMRTSTSASLKLQHRVVLGIGALWLLNCTWHCFE
ncbi:10 TM acyl transferase domain found in Cas1p-domain-containing protein [Exophiala viscosa]|uniref:10 TM acyl transferase domain found in Cas1p-domain-containing protein n=1 Tax=Exophiala viscosa TaxID=2486360 RepID=UPI002192D449|nr:10 TM acyl transferase domain found in Cas1p-domain-containing protein [Exophiala viscosa]